MFESGRTESGRDPNITERFVHTLSKNLNPTRTGPDSNVFTHTGVNSYHEA